MTSQIAGKDLKLVQPLGELARPEDVGNGGGTFCPEDGGALGESLPVAGRVGTTLLDGLVVEAEVDAARASRQSIRGESQSHRCWDSRNVGPLGPLNVLGEAVCPEFVQMHRLGRR